MIGPRRLRRHRADEQASRDVQRAEAALGRAGGIPAQQSARTLERRAADQGISVHAAALAVLSTRPDDDLPTVI